MQWDVSRAFNLLLKQRMEAQEIDLGVPRLSVSMEARSESRMEDTSGTDLSMERGEESRSSSRPTQAEIRQDERERHGTSAQAKPQAQGKPQSEAYARPHGENGDE